MTGDGRRLLLAQGLRATVYGFRVGASRGDPRRPRLVDHEGGGAVRAVLAGTALASIVIARYAERLGRRRCYAALFVGLTVTGVAFGVTDNVFVLVVVALTGTLSTEVVESGPFTSLEQAMLPQTVPEARRTRLFGTYNAVATIAGSLGALAAGGPELLRDAGFGVTDQTLLPRVGAGRAPRRPSISVVFFAVRFLPAGSFLAATRLADRFGLLNTMVFSHLPSNLLLAGVALAPNGAVAIALLLARFALSQMDVPTRQAYVIALVDPDERVAASAYTATARYAVRPAASALGGALQQVSLGLPLLLAGGIKTAYDLAFWSWFRCVPLPTARPEEEFPE